MGKRKAKRVFRQATPKERKRIADLQAKVDQDLPEIKRRGQQLKLAHKVAVDAVQELRRLRASQELSLADVRNLTGMTREFLCKLENNAQANPTVRTLARYADALGMRMLIQFVYETEDRPKDVELAKPLRRTINLKR